MAKVDQELSRMERAKFVHEAQKYLRGAAATLHKKGVDIMQMAAGLDTGDILMREKVAITPTSTPATLLPELAVKSAPLVLSVIQRHASGTVKPQPQPGEGATYASKLTRENGRIDWNKPAIEIERQIRALPPWPGCFSLPFASVSAFFTNSGSGVRVQSAFSPNTARLFWRSSET